VTKGLGSELQQTEGYWETEATPCGPASVLRTNDIQGGGDESLTIKYDLADELIYTLQSVSTGGSRAPLFGQNGMFTSTGR
jgi:hypothetical protein